MCLVAIGFIIQCVIGIIGCRKMMRSRGVHCQLKVLFLLSFTCSCAATICCMMQIVNSIVSTSNTNPFTVYIMVCVNLMAMFLFMAFLLSILVLRIHITFGQTAYRMTKPTYFLFIGILVLLFVLPLVLPVVFGMAAVDLADDIEVGIFSTDSFPDWFLTVIGISMFSFVFYLWSALFWQFIIS